MHLQSFVFPVYAQEAVSTMVLLGMAVSVCEMWQPSAGLLASFIVMAPKGGFLGGVCNSPRVTLPPAQEPSLVGMVVGITLGYT